MLKKIMILGAGVYQLPLIQKAKEMGHHVIVVSPLGNYPGLAFADEVIDLDTRDHIGVLEQAKRIGIDAVLTTGTDVAVPTIGYLVDELGLAGTGYAAAQRSMDKVLMKQCFAEHGIQTAKFSVVEALDELQQCANDMGFPVMVKAVDSSGSRGITQVLTSDALDAAFYDAKAVSKSQKVICEKYLDGYEIGADTFIVGDDVVEIFLHEKYITPPPVSAPIGHSMPLVLPKKIEEKIKILLRKAAASLGLKNTIANADIMIVGHEPYLIEMSARMGGTCIPEVISSYAGFSVYEFMLNVALRGSLNIPVEYSRQANAAFLLYANKSGRLKNIFIPETTKTHTGLVELVIDYQVGEAVRAFKVGPDRIGHIIVKANSHDEANALVNDLAESIVFDIEECRVNE